MKLEQLKTLLAIDKHALDDELTKQPMLFYDIADACVDAIAERDTKKEELASIDAELDGKCRTTLAKREERVTEAMVKNAVQTNAEHEAAFNAYMEAKTLAGKLEALRDSFEQRSRMLRELAGLYQTNYYQTTAVITKTPPTEQGRDRLAQARRERVK